jgi:hypothetical protein
MDFKHIENSPLKDKYFYRTAKWDWLTKEMIHIWAPGKPMMLTMDPWPQTIYLDATGSKTVKEYIVYMAGKYGKKQVPEKLDEFILDELEKLNARYDIIAFSDSPYELSESIKHPVSENRIPPQMIGVWKGLYYADIPNPKRKPGEGTSFTITVDASEGSMFSGNVEDDQATGGTPGIGTIQGKILSRSISFVKQMPVHAYRDQYGNRFTDEKKKHTPLIYEGVFSPDGTHASGIWRFNDTIKWKGIIPYRVNRGTGTWEMSKV